MDELDIQIICATLPKQGRIERANQTLQDRLVKELRLRGISIFKLAMPISLSSGKTSIAASLSSHAATTIPTVLYSQLKIWI